MIGSINQPGGIRPVRFGAGIGAIGGDTYRQAVINTGPVSYWRLGEASGTVANPGAYRAAVLATSPIGYWRLGEASGTAAVDETGTNNGVYNGPTLGAASLLPVDPNTAVTLNGSSQDIRFPVATGWPLGATPRTFAFWHKSSVASFQSLTFYGAAGEYSSLYIHSAGYLRHKSSVAGTVDLTGVGHLLTGLPTFIVATYDGTSWRGYVNGFLDGSPAAQVLNTAAPSGWPICIGSDAGYANGFWVNGQLDEVAIWARALTYLEIENLYAVASALRPASDQMGVNSGVYISATLGTTGLLAGDPDAAVTFNNALHPVMRTSVPVLTAVDNFTMAAWVKPTALAVEKCVIYNGSDVNGYGLWVNGDNTVLASCRPPAGPGQLIPNTTTTISSTAPSFLALVRRNGTSYLYINGALDTVGTTNTPLSPTLATNIGRCYALGGGSIDGFDGTIDEPAIWNRALSAAEIATLYAVGKGIW